MLKQKEKCPLNKQKEKEQLFDLFSYKVIDKKVNDNSAIYTIEIDESDPNFYKKNEIYKLSKDVHILPMFPTFIFCLLAIISMTLYAVLHIGRFTKLNSVELFLMFGLPACILILCAGIYSLIRFSSLKKNMNQKPYSYEDIKKMLEEINNGN